MPTAPNNKHERVKNCKIMVAEIYPSQQWFIEKAQALGYRMQSDGFCHGVALLTLLEFLAQDFDNFVARMRVIYSLTDDDIEVLTTGSKKEKQAVGKKWNIAYQDIFAFFDGIELLQRPDNHRNLFDEHTDLDQLKQAAWPIVKPVAFDNDTLLEPVKVMDSLGAYSLENLTKYYQRFTEIISGMEHPVPISMVLSSINHSINLNYDPLTKQWLLVDANALPVQEYTDCGQLASGIIRAFTAKITNHQTAIFRNIIYTNKKNEIKFISQLNALNDSEAWKDFQELFISDVTMVDSFGANLLILAVKANRLDIINSLIEKGADLDKACSNDWTPLMYAVQFGYLDIIKVLLNNNADLERVNDHGLSALMLAVRENLLSVVKILIEKGAEVNKADNNGWTALMFAIQFGNPEIIDALLNNGADIEQSNNEGLSPLILAVREERLDIAYRLIKLGADVNKADGGEWTALLFAVQSGNVEIATMLIEHGASFDNAYKPSDSPADIAKDMIAGHLLEINSASMNHTICNEKNEMSKKVGTINHHSCTYSRSLAKYGQFRAGTKTVDEPFPPTANKNAFKI